VWRTKATLRHDRAQGERAELRGVIDEALTTAQDGIYCAVDIQSLVRAVARGEEPDMAAYEAAARGLEIAGRKLNGLRSRLEVRLPEGSELPGAVDACRISMGMLRIDTSVVWPESDKADRDELTTTLDEAAATIEALETEARKLAQSCLDD